MSDNPNTWHILKREIISMGTEVTVDNSPSIMIEVVQDGSRVCLSLDSSRKLREALKRAERFEKARRAKGDTICFHCGSWLDDCLHV